MAAYNAAGDQSNLSVEVVEFNKNTKLRVFQKISQKGHWKVLMHFLMVEKLFLIFWMWNVSITTIEDWRCPSDLASRLKILTPKKCL